MSSKKCSVKVNANSKLRTFTIFGLVNSVKIFSISILSPLASESDVLKHFYMLQDDLL